MKLLLKQFAVGFTVLLALVGLFAGVVLIVLYSFWAAMILLGVLLTFLVIGYSLMIGAHFVP